MSFVLDFAGAREKIGPDSQIVPRVCSQCPIGKYQSEGSHRNLFCVSKGTACPEGTRFVAGVDEVKSRDDSACVTCGENTYKVGTSTETRCDEHSMCIAGQFMDPPSTTARRVCQDCAVGTFRADVSHRRLACDPWTECTLEGQFEAVPPTATSDRVCGSTLPCLGDEWESKAMTQDSARQCTKLTKCGPGQKAALSGGNSADLTCVACDEGTFQTAPSHRTTACPPLPPLQCPAGQRPSDKSRTAAQVCQQCTAGELCVQPATTIAATTTARMRTAATTALAASQQNGNATQPAAARNGRDGADGSDSDASATVIIVLAVLLLLACVIVGAVLVKRNNARTSRLPFCGPLPPIACLSRTCLVGCWPPASLDRAFYSSFKNNSKDVPVFFFWGGGVSPPPPSCFVL